jgi:hypothetical protein
MGFLRTAWCELFHRNHSWPMTIDGGRPQQECFDCGRGWDSQTLKQRITKRMDPGLAELTEANCLECGASVLGQEIPPTLAEVFDDWVVCMQCGAIQTIDNHFLLRGVWAQEVAWTMQPGGDPEMVAVLEDPRLVAANGSQFHLHPGVREDVQ